MAIDSFTVQISRLLPPAILLVAAWIDVVDNSSVAEAWLIYPNALDGLRASKCRLVVDDKIDPSLLKAEATRSLEADIWEQRQLYVAEGTWSGLELKAVAPEALKLLRSAAPYPGFADLGYSGNNELAASPGKEFRPYKNCIHERAKYPPDQP